LTVAARRPYHAGGGAVVTVATRVGRRDSPVIELSRARDERRLRDYQHRNAQVIDSNKRALARLFQSGLIYSRAGARLARELLAAHQHLLKSGELLARLAERDLLEGVTAEDVYGEVGALLHRTAALSARSDVILARR
jgi:hypothetical protein